MKIFVTQGHEKGIGLEVFFKASLFLSTDKLKSITLVAFEESVHQTLSSLNYPFKLHPQGIEIAGVMINAKWMTQIEISQSYTCLIHAMQLSETQKGILYTLPTSKDQFPGFPGHTEFFRHHYKKSDLGMFFSSPKLKVLLLSDHIAVKDLSALLTEKLIYSRLYAAISCLKKWHWPIDQVLVAGLNPHAGENGLIGHEDVRVQKVLKRIRDKVHIKITGPYPGDTMLLEQRSEQDILVYQYHDQGLGIFKGIQGYVGSNITLGLPYPRFSPDHGTAFALYGKNESDYRGCAYSLNEALSLLMGIKHGKNSSH